MSLVIWTVVSLIGFLAINAVYVLVQTMVGQRVGARAEIVSVGFGPTLWERTIGGVRYRLSLIPTGGYTKFFGQDDDELGSFSVDERPPGAFVDLSPLRRIAIVASGPLSNLALGALLLAIPVGLQSPQLAVDAAAAVPIHPSGVPHLGLSDRPTTWAGQLELLDRGALGFFRSMIVENIKSPWGGLVSSWITCGAIARAAPGCWLTALGVIAATMGLFNLLPIPILNGGHIIFALLEALHCKVSSEWMTRLAYVGLILTLMFTVVMVYCDLRWCFAWEHGSS
jgi:membrane-associated protease RseP (regulator of RpoE activity)